jgi:hypothetical protein
MFSSCPAIVQWEALMIFESEEMKVFLITRCSKEQTQLKASFYFECILRKVVSKTKYIFGKTEWLSW